MSLNPKPMIDLDALARKIGCDSLEPFPGDASVRRYFRGRKNGKTLVVMVYPPSDPSSMPELQRFKNIGERLASSGIKVPEIYEIDEVQACAILEDLGQTSFRKALHENPKQQEHLYMLACDVLRHLKQHVSAQDLPEYRESRIHTNRRQIIDYYVPFVQKKPFDDRMLQKYLAAWDEIEENLSPCPQGFVHGDFHLENMLYMPENNGMRQCALIDFQDALHGSLPYDLVNLLEDARTDVPEALREKIIARYCEGMGEEEKRNFLHWYRVLGTQFHCRVLGLFIKFSAEQGRDQYLVHIERLQKYIQKSLQHPVLQPLNAFFAKEKIDFLPIKDLNGGEIRRVFRNLST